MHLFAYSIIKNLQHHHGLNPDQPCETDGLNHYGVPLKIIRIVDLI